MLRPICMLPPYLLDTYRTADSVDCLARKLNADSYWHFKMYYQYKSHAHVSSVRNSFIAWG